jgi:hypothetical protein
VTQRNPSPLRVLSRRAVLLTVLVAGTLLLSACGLGGARPQDRQDQLLSAVPSPSSLCTPEALPEVLPGVDEVVDSARLAGFVAELQRVQPPPSGYVLLSLAFDEQGVSSRRAVIEHSTTALVADTIQRLMFAVRRDSEPDGAEWGVRLRIDLANPPRIQVGRREYCPPRARNRQLAAAIEGYTPVGVRYRGGQRVRIIHMRARVGELGTITESHIERGELSGSSLERDVGRHLQQFLFAPALVDGFATSGWVTIPVRVTG